MPLEIARNDITPNGGRWRIDMANGILSLVHLTFLIRSACSPNSAHEREDKGIDFLYHKHMEQKEAVLWSGSAG